MTIKKDDLRIGFFERTGSLMKFTKSDADSKIRLKCAASKFVFPLTRTHTKEGLEFVARTKATA